MSAATELLIALVVMFGGATLAACGFVFRRLESIEIRLKAVQIALGLDTSFTPKKEK